MQSRREKNLDIVKLVVPEINNYEYTLAPQSDNPAADSFYENGLIQSSF